MTCEVFREWLESTVNPITNGKLPMVEVSSRTSGLAMIFGLLLMGGILTGCNPGPGPSTADSPTTPSNRRRGRQPPSKALSSAVDLESLLTEVPEHKGQGRNLFTYGKIPTKTPPTQPGAGASAPTATTVAPTAQARARETPPPPKFDLQFAGYVDAPQAGGDKKKFAVFLIGKQILTGAEGDVIANRYEIIEIGLESVTVSMKGSNVTQKLPLTAGK